MIFIKRMIIDLIFILLAGRIFLSGGIQFPSLFPQTQNSAPYDQFVSKKKENVSQDEKTEPQNLERDNSGGTVNHDGNTAEEDGNTNDSGKMDRKAPDENSLPQIPEIEKDILLDVPFTSQAPLGNWSDPRQEDGCEEASALMAIAWAKGTKLSPANSEKEIIAISDYEQEKYENFHDTSAIDTVIRIFKGYFNYENVEVKYDIGKEDIKAEIYKGNLVIIPVKGRLLGNPNYTPPGPLVHNLVIRGYSAFKKEFITNDPGTRHGEKYAYNEDVLQKALFDYPTGTHEIATQERTAMIIVKKSDK